MANRTRGGLEGMAGVVAALALSSGLVTGCGEEPRSPDDDVASASTPVDAQALVGKWQFVYDDARRHRVEEELAKEIADPAELAKAKAEAVEEAAASEIEFTADGW